MSDEALQEPDVEEPEQDEDEPEDEEEDDEEKQLLRDIHEELVTLRRTMEWLRDDLHEYVVTLFPKTKPKAQKSAKKRTSIGKRK